MGIVTILMGTVLGSVLSLWVCWFVLFLILWWLMVACEGFDILFLGYFGGGVPVAGLLYIKTYSRRYYIKKYILLHQCFATGTSRPPTGS